MGPFLTSFFIAVGAGAWIFVRLQQRTGYGNNKSALIGTVIAAAGIFFVIYLTLKLFWE